DALPISHPAEVAGDRGRVPVEGRHDRGSGRRHNVVALMRVHGHARDVDRGTEVVRDRRESLDGAATEDAEGLEPRTERLATSDQRRDPSAKLALEAALRCAR